MQAINGIDVLTRERVLDPKDKDSQCEFWAEIHATAIWKEFARQYGATQANLQRVTKALTKLYGGDEFGEYFTFNQVVDTLKTLVRSGGEDVDPLDRIPVTPLPVVALPAAVPTDKHGKH